MSDTEPQGCLSVILSLFGIHLGSQASLGRELPYRLRDDFLSPAEFSFYKVLTSAVGNRAVVCSKVNLADIFFVNRPHENAGLRNKIDRKHVDFLLCDPSTMRPKCGLELDDASHARRDRQDRDRFVEQVFRAAGLPLVRVPVKAGYSPAALLALVEAHLIPGPATKGPITQSLPPPIQELRKPVCPKCGVPMVERVAKKGRSSGQPFFGCPNYPRCREVLD